MNARVTGVWFQEHSGIVDSWSVIWTERMLRLRLWNVDKLCPLCLRFFLADIVTASIIVAVVMVVPASHDRNWRLFIDGSKSHIGRFLFHSIVF